MITQQTADSMLDNLSKLPGNLLQEVTLSDLENVISKNEGGETTPPAPEHPQEPRPEEQDPGTTWDEPRPQGPEPGPQPPPRPGAVNLGIIPASSVLLLLDNVLPLAISVLIKLSTGKKIKKSELKATAGERSQIEPHLQAALNTINIDTSNPWNALIIACVAVYGTKTVEILLNDSDTPQEKETPGATKGKRGRPTKEEAARKRQFVQAGLF